MTTEYDSVRKMCIDWYCANGRYSADAFPKSSRLNIRHFNSLAESIKNVSSFSRFDLAHIREGNFSENSYVFFIVERSFKPQDDSLDVKSLKSGTWRYQGHIFKLQDAALKYVTTPALIPENMLENIVLK